MSNVCKKIGNRIRHFRKLRGYTLVNFSAVLHCSKSTLSKYERGEIAIDVITLSNIAEALEIPVNALIESAVENLPALFGNEKVSCEIAAEHRKKAYIYTYFAHQTNPILRLHTLYFNDEKAVLFTYPNTIEKPGGFDVQYSGQIFSSPSFFRVVLRNPKIIDDIFLLDFPSSFRAGSPIIGFCASLSVGSYFPIAAKAIISDIPINDFEWLISYLSFNRHQQKANKTRNCFFVGFDAQHQISLGLNIKTQEEEIIF